MILINMYNHEFKCDNIFNYAQNYQELLLYFNHNLKSLVVLGRFFYFALHFPVFRKTDRRLDPNSQTQIIIIAARSTQHPTSTVDCS